jgi:hypothetical protein
MLFLASVALCSQLSACSRHAPIYTEDEVRQFVLPGIPREAILQRFGEPLRDWKNPKFEDGSTNIDEILYYFLPSPNPPTNASWVFSGFQVRLKDGKAVQWSATHRDTQVGP